MLCAALAGQRGRRVLLIEHYRIVGEKIRISGGGRCNFTNIQSSPANFLSGNPDYCRSALARYTPRDFVALVERHGIRWHEKKLGQLFCDESALQIIAMLKTECERGDVTWWQPCPVDGVAREADAFAVTTPRGTARARSLVVATGGLSVPKIGATAFGYELARQFGLAVVPPRPALVPLAFQPDLLARYGDLSGISVDAEVSCNGGRFRENLLFTHRGLSGPAILQISSYWDGRTPLAIDLVPGVDVRSVVAQRTRQCGPTGQRACAPSSAAFRAGLVRSARRSPSDARDRRCEARSDWRRAIVAGASCRRERSAGTRRK